MKKWVAVIIIVFLCLIGLYQLSRNYMNSFNCEVLDKNDFHDIAEEFLKLNKFTPAKGHEKQFDFEFSISDELAHSNKTLVIESSKLGNVIFRGKFKRHISIIGDIRMLDDNGLDNWKISIFDEKSLRVCVGQQQLDYTYWKTNNITKIDILPYKKIDQESGTPIRFIVQ